MLLSAVYSGEEQKVYLKFYNDDDQGIFFWRDRTNHRPYCYTKMDYLDDAEKIIQKEKKYSSQRIKKVDLIADKEIELLKIIAPDPLSIGGTDNSFRERVKSWEADIRYHENYMYNTGLIPGVYYIRKGQLITRFEQPISNKVQEELAKLIWNKLGQEAGQVGTEQYKDYIQEWANLLNQPIPDIKRVSIDIEVESEEGRMPNAREHDRRVIAVGFCGSDGFRKVLVLNQKKAKTRLMVPRPIFLFRKPRRAGQRRNYCKRPLE